jgi:hypothetical protein
VGSLHHQTTRVAVSYSIGGKEGFHGALLAEAPLLTGTRSNYAKTDGWVEKSKRFEKISTKDWSESELED